MGNGITSADESRRRFILDGNSWRVIFSIGLPLVFYNGIGQIFQFFDTIIASNIGTSVISTVSFVTQIQSMLAATGAGLGIGGGILVARFFGAGDAAGVTRTVNTLVFLALGVALLLLLLLLPFALPVMRLFGMPEDLLTREGAAYFMLEMGCLVTMFLNTIYFSIEKAKGNTRRILQLNLLVLVVKLSLTLTFVYLLDGGMIMLSLASFCAHGILSVFAVRNLLGGASGIRIHPRLADFSRTTLLPILSLSLPVFLDKFIFSWGKVIVNAMGAVYGSMAVGALGISNRLGGMSTMPPMGFQEAETVLISQNIGNGNPRRAVGVFKRVLLLNVSIGLFMYAVMTLFQEPIVAAFSHGDPEFARVIGSIYAWERRATVLLAVSSAVMGLLHGFGHTRVAMLLNIMRLFLFRIPPLWYLQNHSSLGSEGLGVAMMVSNLLVGVSASVAAILFLRAARRGTA